MSNFDRGAYTPPTDEPLAFDARTPQRRRPVPMTLIASGVILIVLLGAVFAFYRSGVRGANEPPRVVGAPVSAIKTPPTPEEAKPVEDKGLDVYVAEPGARSAPPTFAPPPEQPRATPATARAAATHPTPVTSAAPAKREPEPQSVALEEPPLPQVAPTAPVAKAVAHKAPSTKASATVAPGAASAASLRPAEASGAIAAKETRSKPADTAATGGGLVQIGAFNSPAIADQEIAKVRAGFASFVSGKSKRVEPVARDGHTLYRTAFAGFSKAQAQAFCAALKAAGRSCIVK